MHRSARHLISINDLTDDDLESIVTAGAEFASKRTVTERPLEGTVVGIYFRKTSTRTRTAFSAGALRLGAQIITYGPEDLQTNTGETAADTGLIMSRMLDFLVARTAGPTAELHELAGDGAMSLINAMSAAEHPTQALTDVTTLLARFGRVKGLRILYLGEGNNTAAALALALARFPDTELELRTPAGYGLDEQILATAIATADQHGASVVERHDVAGLPWDVDVIYTTRWQTTGSSKADPDWRTAFAPFQVTRALWEHSPKAVFMHDLPAHRGEEVTGDVLDGPASIAFDQAENKLHSAMAALAWCQHQRVLEAGK